jgi:Na+-driven multidrug efflux pump
MNQSHVSDFGTDAIGKLLIGAANFQAFGKVTSALLLTLSSQAFFFIPLIFILPLWYYELGVWMAFPASDLLYTVLTAFFYREMKQNLKVL